MDQKKIGKYIAEKRKALNLTQAQLAEQLGMSDKSVSKWERGVCLPDVSVYQPLCDALEISLNEFLAGEDIPEEAMITKSESTLIQIIREHKVDRNKMKRIIVVLTVIALIVSALWINALIKDGKFMLNYIMPLTSDSPEIQTAEMITGTDAYLYEFNVEDKYNNITLRTHTYKNGMLIDTGTITNEAWFNEYNGKGMITIITNNDDYSVKAIISSSGGVSESEYKMFNKECVGKWFASSVERPEDEKRIDASTEAGLLAVIYDFNDGLCSSISVDVQEDGFWPRGKEYCPELENNDYTIFFTVEFDTAESPEEVQ